MNNDKGTQVGIIPIHQWTNGGDRVMLLKCVNPDMTSYDGFIWPTSGEVKSDRWDGKPTCDGGGFFGWPWGLGIGIGKDADWHGKWIVFSALPENVILVEEGKVKARDARIELVGTFVQCQAVLIRGLVAWGNHHHQGNRAPASTVGDDAPASTVGHHAPASTVGHRAPASTVGYLAPASTVGHHAPDRKSVV